MGIIILIIIGVYGGLMPWFGDPQLATSQLNKLRGVLGFPNQFISGFALMVVMAFIIIPLNKVLKFSEHEIACLFTMALIGCMQAWANHFGLYFLADGQFICLPPPIGGPTTVSKALRDLIPDLLTCLDTRSVLLVLKANAPIPWACWVKPLAFLAIFQISLTLYFMFLSTTLLGKSFIEVEALPFPLAKVEYELVRIITQRDKEVSGSFNKWFWIGFLISFVINFPLLWAFLGPRLLNIPFTWTYWAPVWDFTPLGLLPWVPLVLDLSPHLIGFSYMLSIDVLITGILFVFIMWWILPQVFLAMGKLPAFPSGATYSTVRYGVMGYYETPVVNGYFMFIFGSLVALASWSLWVGRATIIESLKGIFKGEFSEERGFNYRFLGVSTVIFGVLVLIEYIILGVPAWIALVILLCFSLSFLGYARNRAEFGAFVGVRKLEDAFFGFARVIPASLLQMDGTFGLNKTSYVTVLLGGWMWTRVPRVFPEGGILDSLALGKYTKTKYRDVLISAILSILIVVPISLTMMLFYWYQYNLRLLKVPLLVMKAHLGLYMLTQPLGVVQGVYAQTYMTDETVIFLIAGFLLTIILEVLKLKFIKLPINAVVIPIVSTIAGPFLLAPMLIGLLAKYVTLKFAGLVAYERYGIPMAVGMLAGYAFTYLLGGILFQLSVFRLFGFSLPI